MKRFAAILIVVVLLTFTSCFKKNIPQNPPSTPGQNTEVTQPENPEPSKTGQNTQTTQSENINPSNSDSSCPPKDNNNANQQVNTDIPEGLSNKEISWGYRSNKNHTAPEIPAEYKTLLDKYSGYYVGDTSSKVIYLTFDEGYENGYTPKILDILKANDVKAAFFVTRPYIKREADIVKRMVQEGHLVCNHSSTHPSMPSKAGDIEAFNKEFTDTEAMFKEVAGIDMPKFFRPPMGVFSERSLYLTQKLGYKTIFWSFAHKDWLVNEQPSVTATHDKVLAGAHNGEIMLLHAVSKSNTEALDSIIKDLKAQGYRFGTLDELK